MSSLFQEEANPGDEDPPQSSEALGADRILARLAPAIAASLRRVLGRNDPEYEDMLQTALERVFRTLGQSNFRGDCTAAGWAYVIARNVAVDALRARSRERGFVPFDESVQLLAPPKANTPTTQTAAGNAVFTRIGCANCHTASITSGSNAVLALSGQTYHPYSDFLLHDMGSLGDKIGNNGIASPTQMRTAPLWGLVNSDQANLLHDGRAHSIASAIQQHAGQGAAAAAAFNALSSTDSQNLIAFLNSI